MKTVFIRKNVRRKIIRILGLMLCIMLTLGRSGQVYASEKYSTDTFDYIDYANRYPDLKKAFGYNKEKLWNHYNTYGIKEGRFYGKMEILPKYVVFSEKSDESFYFDYKKYADKYIDLKRAFGYDKKALWKHYVQYGMNEGRKVYSNAPKGTAKLMVYETAYKIAKKYSSPEEKIKAAHDWIIDNVEYDRKNYLANTIPERSYRIDGAMLYKTAVCAGYAKTFNYFMYLLGIKTEYVYGYAGNISAGTLGGHAWSRVFLNGEWKYIDVTWDDYVDSYGNPIIRYDYYLKPLEFMKKDHIIEGYITGVNWLTEN